MTSVLFVCLGNICRSPLAEAALREEARRLGLDLVIDSAGTGNWHAGEPPDPRAIAAARRNSVDISGQRARQVRAQDFFDFSEIVALDRSNLRDLFQIGPEGSTARLSLLLDHVPGREGQSVDDPWYGDDEDFDLTWGEATAAARGLAAALSR
jgi:protein-tyrosine phosphatase